MHLNGIKLNNLLLLIIAHIYYIDYYCIPRAILQVLKNPCAPSTQIQQDTSMKSVVQLDRAIAVAPWDKDGHNVLTNEEPSE